MWGPPASGGSTPLRETIPESPSQDGFPDLIPPPDNNSQNSARRVRAGTVPSRFSPGGATPGTNSPVSLPPKSSRPTPSTSPFRSASMVSNDSGEVKIPQNSTSALLSRLRAGSMPQRATFIENASPFASSLFSTGWGSGRERASTLQSIRSSDGPDSPARSSYSKDGLADTDVKTLDYLGLAETPQQSQATLVHPSMQRISAQPFLSELAGLSKSSNRFRSYSVNAKEQYAEEEDGYYQTGQYSGNRSGAMTPMEASAAAALAATQAQIHQHNLAVQAFATHASVNRPRARTAGVLDSPLRVPGRNYLATPSRLENSMTAADFRVFDNLEYPGLPEAVQALHLNSIGERSNLNISDDANGDGPTRALWLGNIPTSTTTTSLQAIFAVYGKIDSARVLVHKNCGFVNFENIESAVQAKSSLNGKEIFPGAGPVRIGYAKVQSASASDTPSNNEIFQSRSPDPYGNGQPEKNEPSTAEASSSTLHVNGVRASSGTAAPDVPGLRDSAEEMMQIVQELGASNGDRIKIAASIDTAIAFTTFKEISPVPEPGHARVHDAPKLREIRKRIDNNSITQAEMEEIAIAMLPEISELASDYLGNTVLQKLFDFCSETVKEQMLVEIGPHLAEISVHKNGTWASQKMIDVAKLPSSMAIIVNSLRPYTVSLFLDQWGNYVLQCCLPFGFPWNNFIFETISSRTWEIAQGRYGARAIRACLESHHATKDQQRLVASVIVLHSVQLATNANGALLLTWYLDTCTFPRRRAVLAPRLVPHLVRLCTHKVAYLTVLKMINQRNEPEARDTIFKALFFSEKDKVLEEILSDQVCGATLIFKILTTPFFDENLRSDIVQNVRNVLCRLKASPSQGYKRLMDEVGLSARTGKADRENQNTSRPNSRHDRNRPISQHGANNGRKQQTDMERQYNSQFFPPAAQQHFPVQAGIPVTSTMDPNVLSPYEQFTPAFTPNQYNPQFQPALTPSVRGINPGEFYPGITGAGLNGYAPTVIDANYRNLQTQPSSMTQRPIQMGHNGLLQQSAFGVPPGFNSMVGSSAVNGTYPYPMQYFPQQQQQVMQQHSGGRRGRVSDSYL